MSVMVCIVLEGRSVTFRRSSRISSRVFKRRCWSAIDASQHRHAGSSQRH